ncbi:3-mercaptopyruvate sulfurtransferase isoform X1 [Petromyzon marinus]|uniref:3-mercaptopyruvate sulfurtransferase isoform X1 n=1 Tax=Petromyzon marinus TaxID=7757 RepID=UPI003F708B68
MSASQPPALVSARWLFENISPSPSSSSSSPPPSSPPPPSPLGPALVVLDASWHVPGTGRDARQEFVHARVPGAAFFDLDESSDRQGTFGLHAMPTAAAFTLFARGLGVSARSHVVVYDRGSSDPTAARAWWMFRAFGHSAVSLLDGGLEAWRAAGFPLEAGLPNAPAASGVRLTDGGDGGGDGDGAWLFHATEPPPGQLKSFEEIRDNVSSKEFVLVDSRPEGRVTSSEPQLLPDFSSSHIPGSVSMPYSSVMDPHAGLMLGVDALRAEFERRGVPLGRPFVATCISGVTACMLLLAAHLCGAPDGALYDGSLLEWTARAPAEDVATGPGRGEAPRPERDA